MPRQITIDQFLSDAEIQQAVDLWKTDRNNFHKRCLNEIIKPNIRRINADLGQENDPSYLAYMVEYVMDKVAP